MSRYLDGVFLDEEDVEKCIQPDCTLEDALEKRKELNAEKGKLHSKLVGMLATPRSSTEEFLSGMKRLKEIEDEMYQIETIIYQIGSSYDDEK